MTRLPDWEIRLARAEDGLVKARWRWGTHDCAQAVLQIVEALTGEELRAGFGYGSRQAARRILRKNRGLYQFAGSIADRLGLGRVSPNLAQRGDPCVVVVGKRQALGWIGGKTGIFVASEQGIDYVPRRAAVACWSVPCPR